MLLTYLLASTNDVVDVVDVVESINRRRVFSSARGRIVEEVVKSLDAPLHRVHWRFHGSPQLPHWSTASFASARIPFFQGSLSFKDPFLSRILERIRLGFGCQATGRCCKILSAILWTVYKALVRILSGSLAGFFCRFCGIFVSVVKRLVVPAGFFQ